MFLYFLIRIQNEKNHNIGCIIMYRTRQFYLAVFFVFTNIFAFFECVFHHCYAFVSFVFSFLRLVFRNIFNLFS
jgi:hypothetical protein